MQETIGTGIGSSFEMKRGAVEIEGFEREAAGILGHAVGREHRLRAKEIAEALGDEPRDRAGKLRLEADPFGLAAQVGRAVENTLSLRIERQRYVKLVERTGAGKRQRKGRPAFDAQQIGDDAVCRFLQRQVEVEDAGIVGILRGQRKLSSRPVETPDGKLGIKRPAFQAEPSLD
ncbi:hypothetical protein L598_000100000910 [Mesorhizobium sp. J18]|nr:hypothetical protein L598_000100000910 [Mesorhizobium sp. J18]